ncbi:MAG: hypothetical protein JJU40_01400 [Rhodobacteraceae bacterium]|nr:hypothetical protein [Paracoccaceae bacterium]
MIVARVCALAAVAALGSGAAPAFGSERLSPVAVPKQQAMDGVEIELSLRTLDGSRALRQEIVATTRSPTTRGLPELKLGDYAEICFAVTSDGYITVWSRSADNRPVVIYPNSFSHAGEEATAVVITGGERHCIGADDRFRLRVSGRAGAVSTVYVHWTPGAGAQLGSDDFPAIGDRSPAPSGQAAHAGSTIEYRIVE